MGRGRAALAPHPGEDMVVGTDGDSRGERGRREAKIQGKALASHPGAALGPPGRVLICSMFVCCFVVLLSFFNFTH